MKTAGESLEQRKLSLLPSTSNTFESSVPSSSVNLSLDQLTGKID